MTRGEFIHICWKEDIRWNDIVRIRIIRPKRLFGIFRKITGMTIKGALNSYSAYVEICADDDNGNPIMHYLDFEDIIAVEKVK